MHAHTFLCIDSDRCFFSALCNEFRSDIISEKNIRAVKPLIKIIFSDMDGTLLDDRSQLPADFDETMSELKRRGVIFAPASGRQYFSLLRSFGKYADEFLFVAENGTLVMRNRREIFSKAMKQSEALEILSTAIDGDDDVFRVYCGKKNAYFLESQIRPENLAELEKYFTQNITVEKFTDVDDEPLKMSFFDADGTVAETVYPILSEKYGRALQVVLSSDYWVDVMAPGINKGVAIENVQRIMGIAPEECAAFGDYLNDAEMMRAVGYGFAMANAHPDLKKIARYETASNDEAGVLMGIRRLIDEGLI